MNDTIINKCAILFNDTLKDLKINIKEKYISRYMSEDSYFKLFLKFLDNSIFYSRHSSIYDEYIISGKYLNQKVNKWKKLNIF